MIRKTDLLHLCIIMKGNGMLHLPQYQMEQTIIVILNNKQQYNLVNNFGISFFL